MGPIIDKREAVSLYEGSITDVRGITVGHASDYAARTGVTVVLAQGGALAGADVRGGAPGTRETDVVAPGRLDGRMNAVLLAGGSAFGLDAAAGVMRYLAQHGQGFDTGYGVVPIVGGAVLFDLAVGDASARPTPDMAYAACENASVVVPQGRHGAGCGATVGKLLVPDCVWSDGGVGTASIRLPDGCVVGAIAAVNAAGDIYDPDTGRWLAGARRPDGPPVRSVDAILRGHTPKGFGGNTTIGVIATNARLDPGRVQRLALLAHDGYARAIRPVHMPVDGDTVFALSTGEADANYLTLCAAASEVMARAIANAVLAPA